MNSWPKWVIALVIAVLILCCCAIIVGAGILGFTFFSINTVIKSTTIPFFDVTAGPYEEQTSTPLPGVFGTPPDETANENLRILENNLVPNADLRELAARLRGIKNIPETVPDLNAPHKAGESGQFWVLDNDSNKSYQITATLQYVTPHLYFWVENGANFDAVKLKTLADEFENKIYPTDRKFFGSEWTPGIDEDVHLYLVYAKTLGSHIAGYFASVDEVPPQAYQYSNAHEGFMVAQSQPLDATYTYGVLAHEFQHMIHWANDLNEESWMNEGFSELAVDLNDYGRGDKAFLYAAEPDTILTDWPTDPNQRDVHYGVAYMFVKYFLDRFGDTATQALVSDKRNGLDSIDGTFKDLNETDPVTGKTITANDLFSDWVVANFLQDPNVGDGRYSYKNYLDAPKFDMTDSFRSCPLESQERSVNQYGVDYIRIGCRGSYTLKFEGSSEVGILPVSAHSGDYAFWSSKGDDSDMTIEHTFDFTSVTEPINIDYWTWYDLEKDYDYAYLEASQNGQEWEILDPPSCTKDNPSGNSYGCGYNNVSDGWREEKVDLSKFAGSKVTLRFEYVTDPGVNGEGLLLDDISIPAINYSTDFEKDTGGWKEAGFVRIENSLPQTFLVSLIHEGGQVTVERLQLNDDNTLSLPLQLDADVILVVSGSTRYTRQEASYRLSVIQ
jgi:immune inhibitor A